MLPWLFTFIINYECQSQEPPQKQASMKKVPMKDSMGIHKIEPSMHFAESFSSSWEWLCFLSPVDKQGLFCMFFCLGANLDKKQFWFIRAFNFFLLLLFSFFQIGLVRMVVQHSYFPLSWNAIVMSPVIVEDLMLGHGCLRGLNQIKFCLSAISRLTVSILLILSLTIE